jgi:hypothetical protein
VKILSRLRSKVKRAMGGVGQAVGAVAGRAPTKGLRTLFRRTKSSRGSPRAAGQSAIAPAGSLPEATSANTGVAGPPGAVSVVFNRNQQLREKLGLGAVGSRRWTGDVAPAQAQAQSQLGAVQTPTAVEDAAETERKRRLTRATRGPRTLLG